MGNQHTQDELNLAYLAGLIDGEGTITLERSGIRRLNGVMGLSPVVLVANTDLAIVEFVTNQFRRMGANPHIKTQAKGYAKRQKQCYWVKVHSLTKAKKVLEPVIPYLIGKRAQAQLILDFVAYRGDSQLAKGKPYGPYELGILEKIRALNHRGVSETEDHGLSRPQGRESNDSPLLRENAG